MTAARNRTPSLWARVALAVLAVVVGPAASAVEVGAAFLVFDITTGRLSMNPGNRRIDSYSIGAATNDMRFDGLAVFPSGTTYFSENTDTRIGAAFYLLTAPDIAPNSPESNESWGSISSSRDPISGQQIGLQPNSTSGHVILSAITGTPEWSFGFVGPTNLTLETALAGLGATEQGGLATNVSRYSAVGFVGQQTFRVYTVVSSVPEPCLLLAAAASGAIGARGFRRLRCRRRA